MTMKLLAILLVSKYYCMYNLLETFNLTENILLTIVHNIQFIINAKPNTKYISFNIVQKPPRVSYKLNLLFW